MNVHVDQLKQIAAAGVDLDCLDRSALAFARQARATADRFPYVAITMTRDHARMLAMGLEELVMLRAIHGPTCPGCREDRRG